VRLEELEELLQRQHQQQHQQQQQQQQKQQKQQKQRIAHSSTSQDPTFDGTHRDARRALLVTHSTQKPHRSSFALLCASFQNQIFEKTMRTRPLWSRCSTRCDV
jgi:FtsZ-interacting cell division protein YlmF